MQVALDPAWIILLLLAAARIAGVLLFTPVLGFGNLPPNIRVFLVLILASVVVGASGAAAMPEVPSGLSGLVVALGGELLLGGVLGFGILAAFGSLAVAGRLLDYQIGFGIATLFDPATQVHGSLMGALLTMLGATLFLTLDAHHTLIRGLAYAFQTVPAGSPVTAPLNLVIGQFGLMFVYGIVLVAPAVFALMLMDLVIGFASRLMPQVNAYFVAMPAKVFVGLLVTAISLRFSGGLVQGMFEQIFGYWQQALAVQGHG